MALTLLSQRPGVPHPSYALFGGYVVSSLIGGALTFSGFSVYASKFASFVRYDNSASGLLRLRSVAFSP